MTTTQKIQAVLATGKLGLPEDLWQPGSNYWSLGYDMEDREHVITDQQAHDLIAMHWAREMPHDLLTGDADKEFDRLMGGGLAEAAIKAIHEALCGGKE